jgi:hypothetical protein
LTVMVVREFRLLSQAVPVKRLAATHRSRKISLSALTLVALVLICTAKASGQSLGGRSEVFAGSELEDYLRFQQSLGAIPLYPWTSRAFSAHELDRLMDVAGDHQWKDRFAFGGRDSARSFDVVWPTVSVRYNSAFPFGSNDGPIWAGRGLTTSLQMGFAARFGPFSLEIAPEIFSAQNRPFPLFANSDTGRLRFADGQFGGFIDRPQRFGDKAYNVFDPGQSTLRIDIGGVAAGVSTANEIWGPASFYPYVLSNNAAGIPHAFIGTAQPANLYLFRLTTKVQWGILSQSHYSPVGGSRYIVSVQQPGTRRFMSAIVATIQPRWMDGLEIGGSRFFHTGWPQNGPTWADFRRPLEAIFKYSLRPEPPLPGSDQILSIRENQVASVFARWVIPNSGFEVYGEFGREDHSADLRDFLQEPDHGGASRMLGFRKIWRSGYALRAEEINFEAPQIAKQRSEGGVYLHTILRQGHTQLGQVLGADVGAGSGAGATVAFDRYTTGGKMTFSWSRTIGHELGQYYLTGVDGSNSPDVLHTLSAESLRFVGRVDVITKASLTADLNRNFQSDVYNLSLEVGTRFGF